MGYLIPCSFPLWTSLKKIPEGRTPIVTFEPTIWYNPDIRVDGCMVCWELWIDWGIHYISQIIDNLKTVPFHSLVTWFELPTRKFLRYHQIKAAITFRLGLQGPSPNLIPHTSQRFLNCRLLASRLYKALSSSRRSGLVGIESTWNSYLQSTRVRHSVMLCFDVYIARNLHR